MPFFSKRKSGKQKAKVGKHGQGLEKNTTQATKSQRVKQQDVGLRQSFNGVSLTPDLPRKDLLKASQRPANSTAKCVANFPRRSRLSKSLPEVLVDDSILPLFLEFLQRLGAQSVLNFWLAAETFRLSSQDKTLFRYKSRLKLKRNQEFGANASNIPNDLHKIERNVNSKESLEEDGHNFDSILKSANSDVKSTTPGSDLGVIEGKGLSYVTTEVSSMAPRNSENFHQKTPAISTLARVETDNNCPNDSSNNFRSPLLYNSMNSNIILPSCSELPNASPTIDSVSEITAGQNTSTDNLVSERNTSSNDQSSDIQKSSDVSNRNMHNTDSSDCCTPFQSDKQALGISASESVNELCYQKRLQNDGLATEVIGSQETVVLRRQESNDTKERRRRSKVMMDDALSIYRHFISLDASQPLGVDENTRREVESNICTENGIIDPDCFNVAQKFAFNTLQNRYFDDFIRSSYYQKHIMDILTGGKVFLADIMYNDSAMFYFMEFMEQEEKSYLIAFWIAVDSFCQELQSKLDKKEYNADEALDDAMVLYEKYFSMQASNSLGVSDETRIRIENKICREGGPLPECFEEPMENVLTLLEEVYFPIFLDSSVYMKYLNELFSSVTDIDSDHTCTCADDASSTASTGETSTLMESLVNDVEAHDDPDEIWQRPQFGLSIGRVNEFGIYEPGIEPQPGKEVLKFGQKMKKLVSGDSEKVKEEMAWKVAKMVLEDVKKQQKKAK